MDLKTAAHVRHTMQAFWSSCDLDLINGFVVAYSGGLDSTVLLSLCRNAPKPVRSIHIHHGLQSMADDWQSHCEQTAKLWRIPHTSLRLETQPQPGESIEAWARTARYQVLLDALLPGECLLTAHHEDDQAETLLIQLCRGAGLKGMAAMPMWRSYTQRNIDHARPLLTLTRLQLQAYAVSQQLSYCEDPSNANTQFLRNHIRHQVMPLLRRDFPEVQRHLARGARHCAEAADLLEELAYMDVPELAAKPLDMRDIQRLSRSRQKNVLRTWLSLHEVSMPSEKHMHVLLQEVIQSRYDKIPLLAWGDVIIRRYGYLLYVTSPQIQMPYDWQIIWDGSENLLLPSHLGCLLAADVAHWKDNFPLTVRFRREGEVVRLWKQSQHKSLKKLMQHYRVPPWLRDRTPLLFSGDYLLAIVGYYRA